MDDKCWFVLRQRHYPPPTKPAAKPKGKAWEGPICLGHVIPSPKKLDQVKNRSHLRPYPADMPVYQTKTWHLAAELDSEHQIEGSAKLKAPVGALPLNVSVDASAVFKKTVQNHSLFERLDTMIIQPTDSYIKDTLRDSSVATLIERKRKENFGLNMWSLYMISGIAVAVGASGKREESQKKKIGGGVGVELPGVVGGRIGGAASTQGGTMISFKKASDFVWAVRLTKISKELLSSDVKNETFIIGATYSREEGKLVEPKIEDILKVNGLDPKTTDLVHADVDDTFFVIQQEIPDDGPDSDEEAAVEESSTTATTTQPTT